MKDTVMVVNNKAIAMWLSLPIDGAQVNPFMSAHVKKSKRNR